MLLLKWIICTHVSFSEVEHPQFRELLTYCNSVLEDILPRSHNTIRNWILKDFEFQKTYLQSQFESFDGQIHISFDMWTSTNSLALLGIVEHWINTDGAVWTALLGLWRLQGQHTGENISYAVASVIEEYSLQHKIGYFMLDNASTNDVCVSLLC